MVGFGFSVGDFIRAVRLVGTVTDALSASSKSTAELQELLRQLHSLQTALREIENLNLDESLHNELFALKESAAQSRLTITQFLRTTESYQRHLLPSTAGINWWPMLGETSTGMFRPTFPRVSLTSPKQPEMPSDLQER